MVSTFRRALQDRGWTEGRNLRMDVRWGEGNAERNRRFAAELVALAPDVILAGSGSVVAALQKATRTVPIVFTLAIPQTRSWHRCNRRSNPSST